ncbi:MAG TPA: nucleoside triphosphate pyrophosphohydrolase [Gammaproteobacteria bacterium]|nr:nucleoside triphosphate pyrophosphohydrolase [Gammaproteobacteria bacterium]
MNKQSDKRDIQKLLEIMARLRAPDGGCPWDLEQTFATIAPYTIEEAYEVADAIERGALDDLRGELGDLLFQVVFHARMAEEAGAFDFGDVVAGIAEKLERRHPHVFGERRELGVAEQSRLWEEIKRDERERRRTGDPASPGSNEAPSSVLADVPVGLPGLSRAAKLGKRAATVGFDWPDVAGVRAKLSEELGELDAALAGAERAEVAAEIGDLLFTVANLCRHLDLDAEACVRGANARFEKRFAHVERRVRAAGGEWSAHDPLELDRFWREAKSATR